MKILRHPAAKFAVLACLGLILYLIATSSGAGWLYVISASTAGVLLFSAFCVLWNTRSIEVVRHAPPSGTAGEPLRCSIELRNTGRLPRYMLEMEDRFAGDTGRSVAVRVKRGESARLEYTVENPRRGVYSGGEVRISSSAPFGLLRGRRRLRVLSSIVIHPRIFFVAGLPEPASYETAGSETGEATVPQRGLGDEFWGVREYRPGDPARLIAWRRSARSLHDGRLAVMEMSHRTSPPLTIALDLDPRAPANAREMAISAAASLLLHALKEGREVSADAGPQRSSFPEKPDAGTVLDWGASLEPAPPPQTENPDIHILPSLKHPHGGEPRAATVVLVSCHQFAGPGPWMTPDEEKEFLDGFEASGRRAVRLDPDFPEPWRIV